MLSKLYKEVKVIIYIYCGLLLFVLSTNISFFQNFILQSESTLNLINFILVAESIIFYIYIFATIWFVYKSQLYNLERGVKDLKYSAKWIWIWWWIPFLNLWMPYKVVKETYLSSFKTKKEYFNYSDKNIFWSWWGSFVLALLSPVIGRTYIRLNYYEQFPPEYYELILPFEIASGLLIIFSAFSFLQIIKQISKNEILTVKSK